MRYQELEINFDFEISRVYCTNFTCISKALTYFCLVLPITVSLPYFCSENLSHVKKEKKSLTSITNIYSCPLKLTFFFFLLLSTEAASQENLQDIQFRIFDYQSLISMSMCVDRSNFTIDSRSIFFSRREYYISSGYILDRQCDNLCTCYPRVFILAMRFCLTVNIGQTLFLVLFFFLKWFSRCFSQTNKFISCTRDSFESQNHFLVVCSNTVK